MDVSILTKVLLTFLCESVDIMKIYANKNTLKNAVDREM